MNQIYIGVGTNLGDRQAHLNEAKRRLSVPILQESPIYETEPVGFLEQPWFFNAVWEIQTDLDPTQLLGLCQRVEKDMGRERLIPKGPRVIDLDILFYGTRVCDDSDLKIPHPEIPNRRFVLMPMNDLAPDFVHPVLLKTIAELLRVCPDRSLIQPL